MKLGMPAMGFLREPDRPAHRRLGACTRVGGRAGSGPVRDRAERRPDPRWCLGGSREHTITFAGRQESRKGLQVLLRAWPELHASYRRALAGVRIGSARGAAALHAAARPGRGDRHSRLPAQERATALLSRTKVLVAPSLGGESFGMVLTRAFACALPVVASDIPGYREVTTPEHAISVAPAIRRTRRGSHRAARRRAPPGRDGVAARASPSTLRVGATSRAGSRGSTSVSIAAQGARAREPG